ncbi:TRAP transporter small permease [Jeotgalibacillus proteolyticus]|uniref:TRAP transporter small permease n=1 Tax=Jeotgalibacillus proteolyticus TaxID=2082395 RepID=A0A2S5G865_9BACL|nr:TRAP transporter small permease [Jeotgalibacillus proteolyticus]PPA69133.1 TRAP transporter small permease [Jeotgalibacillus proteolyticus]
MKKFRSIIDLILSVLTIASFTGVIVIITVQIISRFAPFSFIWTEELTRYLFIYAICFGAPLALIRNEFINVDLLLTKMSDHFRKYYETLIYLSIIVLSGVMVKESYSFTLIGNNQASATMPFKLSVIHAALLMMSIFLIFYSVLKIIDLLKNDQEFKRHYEGEEF